MNQINYKFNEGALIKELQSYIDSTYDQHYGKGKIQSTEVIIDRGRGMDFCLGNVDKYSQRYGNKGTPDDYRKDLMKILHYALISLYVHDLKHKSNSEKQMTFTFNADNYTDEAIYTRPNMVYNNGSIDNITPYQWNEMNIKHLNELKETK